MLTRHFSWINRNRLHTSALVNITTACRVRFQWRHVDRSSWIRIQWIPGGREWTVCLEERLLSKQPQYNFRSVSGVYVPSRCLECFSCTKSPNRIHDHVNDQSSHELYRRTRNKMHLVRSPLECICGSRRRLFGRYVTINNQLVLDHTRTEPVWLLSLTGFVSGCL